MLAVDGVGMGFLRRRALICLAAHTPDPMPSCQARLKCDCPVIAGYLLDDFAAVVLEDDEGAH
jgi:hypothetical protein